MINEPVGRDWRTAAVCAALDPEVFYPLDLSPGAAAVLVAKRVCAVCPVQPACLRDVMAAEDPARRWGVIAATTPDERNALFLAQRPALVGSGAVAA